MSTSDPDPIEREALTFIVRQLEAGRAHIRPETFRPFLESLGAGGRLVAILTYFEALGVLTAERRPRDKRNSPPSALGTIPAYWRIEGEAVILHRALLNQKPGKNQGPREGKRRRGRPGDTDPKADEQIWDAWKTGAHKEYAELAHLLRMSPTEVARAIDRHRHRRARTSADRRINTSDQ
jgi:hypothetical protein